MAEESATGLRFGTSGVRGPADALTDVECARLARAFIRFARSRTPVRACAVGGDLRASTPRILAAVVSGLRREGVEVRDCGRIATPALALYALQERIPAVMVTGSHIPADRNGIKFYLPEGEILKADEGMILEEHRRLAEAGPETFSEGQAAPQDPAPATVSAPEAESLYIERYLRFFPPGRLSGLRLVVYQHSSVARRVLGQVLEELGAVVRAEGSLDSFLAVDTEAVENLEELGAWVRCERADALVSTDGDGDRPLVLDDQGRQVRGDLLGLLAARYLQADSVSIPVSCSTAVERCGWFGRVRRTRIGSPWVIEAMLQERAAGYRTVVGWEANGGFLTASPVVEPESGGKLDALPTRDALLPVLAVLAVCRQQQASLSELLRRLPPVFNCSGILRRFPQEVGERVVQRLAVGGIEEVGRLFGKVFGSPLALDLTDGARMTFAGNRIVHLRPSGNAPEFRCYSEAPSQDDAERINREALEIVAGMAAGESAG